MSKPTKQVIKNIVKKGGLNIAETNSGTTGVLTDIIKQLGKKVLKHFY